MAVKKKKEYRVSWTVWSSARAAWQDLSNYKDAVSPEAAARSVARDQALPDGLELVVEEIARTSFFTTTSKTIRNVESTE